MREVVLERHVAMIEGLVILFLVAIDVEKLLGRVNLAGA